MANQVNQVLEHLIFNILGGHDETKLKDTKDVKFLLLIVDEVDFIIHLLVTWRELRDLGIVWFREPERNALAKAKRLHEVSRKKIFEKASEIWDKMAQALASTNTMHPKDYILPSVRVIPYKTQLEHDQGNVLGWYHLGVLYPITKAENFLKEARLRSLRRRNYRNLVWYRSQHLAHFEGPPGFSNIITPSRPSHPNRYQPQRSTLFTPRRFTNYIVSPRYGCLSNYPPRYPNTVRPPRLVNSISSNLLGNSNEYQAQHPSTVRPSESVTSVSSDRFNYSRCLNDRNYARNPSGLMLPIDLTQSVYPQKLDMLADDSGDRSHQITSTLHFPQIKAVMEELMNNLITKSYDQLQHMPYKRTINHYGREVVIEKLYSCVNQHIKSLEGNIVDANLLRSILSSQRDTEDPWLENSGYVDIVLDDRNSEYWRAYVGQTQYPSKRLRNHIRGAMKQQPDTLHYYVIWKGRGHRSMNFLRLWTIDITDDFFEDEGEMFLFSNILEMSLARAFESLPTSTLKLYFDEPEDQPFSGVGLNILAPLMQGISASLYIRQAFTLRAEASIDPDISSWPAFRANTREPDSVISRWNKDIQVVTWEDYIKRLKASITTKTGLKLLTPLSTLRDPGEPLFSLKTWEKEFVDDVNKVQRDSYQHDTCHMVSPFGRPEAAIGVLINRALISEDIDEKAVPWGILESGFNDTNSLKWFWDPRLNNMEKRAERKASTQAVLRKHNQLLIEQSHLTVILLDKSIDTYLDLEADTQIHKVEHMLHCGQLTFYIKLKDRKMQRIYIQSPTSFTSLFAAPGPVISRICEMFKYAAVLTETNGINPFFTSTRSAIHHIVRTYCEEKSGSEKMTIETINPIIQAWLFRKGFNKIEDLQCLQDFGGGSLANGSMLLLHALKRTIKSVSHRRIPTAGSSGKRKRGNNPSTSNPLNFAAVGDVERLYKKVRVKGTTSGDVALGPIDDEANEVISEIANEQTGADSLMAIVDEVIGPVSSQCTENISAVATEKYDELLTKCAPEETEWIELDMNDTGLDEPIQENEDVEPEQNLTAIPHGDGFEIKGAISAPLKRVKRASVPRSTIQELLQHGRMYSGYWLERSALYRVICSPALANIFLQVSILQREEVPKEVLIKAYLDPGEAHPRKWAMLSTPGDPGARVAFTMTINGCTTWLYSKKEGAIKKANTFADYAMDVPVEEIIKRPRRHINIQDQPLVRACGVEKTGTYFTDDKCKLTKRVIKERKLKEKATEENAK